ncbi:GerAB/ArcD/ProY family transporter [Selenihalanaerobacter shriftii]|uniref:Spore germination protein n=1 Tax=Selenihalanaerobacter shriftii TaxID=142842 RepID=A0A1T4NVM1_9FIRM|nr:endospore germination permease [Selenihalanaerobacter shriftii]SJZ83273.1 spore germination protein [Selenihalanaerobacter shriftii]
MLNVTNDKINGYQLFMLIIGVLIGVGIVTLPRTVIKGVNQDGWIIPLIGGVIVIIDTYFIVKLGQAFPEDTFIDYVDKIVGKFVGKILSLGLLLYFLLMTSTVLPIFALGLRPLLLERTPTEIIYVTVLALLLYIARHGIEPIARLNQLITPAGLIIFFFLLGGHIIMPTMDYGRLRPILYTTPITKLFKQAIFGPGLFALVGVEIIYVIFPLLNNKAKKQCFKISSLAILFVILLYSLTIILAIAHFGAAPLENILFPTLTLIQEIDLPFLERLISAFVSVWFVIGFTTTMITVYAGAGLGLANLLKFKEPKFLIPFALVPPYFLGLIPQNIIQVFKYSSIVNYFTIFYLLILPPTLFVIYKLKRLIN